MGEAVFSYRSLPHWGRGTASAVDRVLSYNACLRCIFHLFQLSFMPLVPYPPLRGTFPSRGRLTIRGYHHLKCGEAATSTLSPSCQSTHSTFIPPSFGRRCPEGAEVGSRCGFSHAGMPTRPRFARLLLPEEGARMILNRASSFI